MLLVMTILSMTAPSRLKPSGHSIHAATSQSISAVAVQRRRRAGSRRYRRHASRVRRSAGGPGFALPERSASALRCDHVLTGPLKAGDLMVYPELVTRAEFEGRIAQLAKVVRIEKHPAQRGGPCLE